MIECVRATESGRRVSLSAEHHEAVQNGAGATRRPLPVCRGGGGLTVRLKGGVRVRAEVRIRVSVWVSVKGQGRGRDDRQGQVQSKGQQLKIGLSLTSTILSTQSHPLNPSLILS